MGLIDLSVVTHRQGNDESGSDAILRSQKPNPLQILWAPEQSEHSS